MEDAEARLARAQASLEEAHHVLEKNDPKKEVKRQPGV